MSGFMLYKLIRICSMLGISDDLKEGITKIAATDGLGLINRS